MARRTALVSCLWLALLPACDGCSDEAALQVEGPYAYVRCGFLDAPSEGEHEAGGLSFVIEGRTLSLVAAPSPLRIVAFRGAAPSDVPLDEAVAIAKELDPHLVLVLGGVGDTAEVAARNVATLGEFGVPVLVLAGGRDDAETFSGAFGALPGDIAGRVLDARGLRSLEAEAGSFALLSGAEDGRYARVDGACGFGAEDLQELAEDLGDTELPRWLVSWTAPAGQGAAAIGRGDDGVEAGSSAVAEFMERIGARGGVFAWPDANAGAPASSAGLPLDGPAADLRIVVPPAAGPTVERPDGTRVLASATLLLWSIDGLDVVEPGTP